MLVDGESWPYDTEQQTGDVLMKKWQWCLHIAMISPSSLRYQPQSAYSHSVTLKHANKHFLTNNAHTYTHTHLTAHFPGLPRWASTRKVEPIWILLKQETVSGSGISWARCKSAPYSRQITMPAPHRSVFTGRMPFVLPNQQRQSTEGITNNASAIKQYISCVSSKQLISSNISNSTARHVESVL